MVQVGLCRLRSTFSLLFFSFIPQNFTQFSFRVSNFSDYFTHFSIICHVLPLKYTFAKYVTMCHVTYPINALTGRCAHAQLGSNDNCYLFFLHYQENLTYFPALCFLLRTYFSQFYASIICKGLGTYVPF